MNVHQQVDSLADSWSNGGARYWVNDTFDGQVDVAVLYDHTPELNDRFKAVGLVDEKDGGMVAYGKPEIMEKLAHDLNKLDALEKIAAAQEG